MKRDDDFTEFLTKYPDMAPELAIEYGNMDALMMEVDQDVSSDDHEIQSHVDAVTNGTQH
ncbi:MAG: hypothetical protein R8K46_02875 [Mariprofundaceae bacterium]